MKKKIDELPDGVEANDGQIAWKGDIYDQVINKPERYGQVRGVGLGICPSKLWGGQSSCSQSSNATITGDGTEVEIEKLIEERIKVVQENHQKELRAMQEKSNVIIKKVLDRQSHLERQLSKLITFLTERAEGEGYESVSLYMHIIAVLFV